MKNIGVIDSGIGGLTVLFDVLTEYPNCNYFYIGDSKNCPYGIKSVELIQKLSFNLVNYLVNEKNIDILIIACNSISSTSTEYLKEKFKGLLIIETINPTSAYAKNYVQNNKIGIIATEATVNSKAYENHLEGYEVFSRACPNLVTIVENGINEKEEKIVIDEIRELVNKDIDTLILGCTHFPLLIPTIRKVYGGTIVTSSKAIILSLDRILSHENILGSLKIYTTGDQSEFKNKIKKMFKRIENVEKLNL